MDENKSHVNKDRSSYKIIITYSIKDIASYSVYFVTPFPLKNGDLINSKYIICDTNDKIKLKMYGSASRNAQNF